MVRADSVFEHLVGPFFYDQDYMLTPSACQVKSRLLLLWPIVGANVPLMVLTKEAREFFVKQGRKGGKAYAKNSTPEQRKAAARRAAQARWAKSKKKTNPPQ